MHGAVYRVRRAIVAPFQDNKKGRNFSGLFLLSGYALLAFNNNRHHEIAPVSFATVMAG